MVIVSYKINSILAKTKNMKNRDKITEILYKNSSDTSECLVIRFEKIEGVIDKLEALGFCEVRQNLKFEEFMNNFCKNGITLTNNYTRETISFKDLVKKYKQIQ